jgi:hypothetical protein
MRSARTVIEKRLSRHRRQSGAAEQRHDSESKHTHRQIDHEILEVTSIGAASNRHGGRIFR